MQDPLVSNSSKFLSNLPTIYFYIGGVCYVHTSNFPMEDETLTILGELDNWRRGMSASAILLAP
jgi:hypothetical protein